MNKIGNRAFQTAPARPALPVSRQMSASLRVAARIQLAIGGERQLLIGKMTIWRQHS
jgi:hypothetical protein